MKTSLINNACGKYGFSMACHLCQNYYGNGIVPLYIFDLTPKIEHLSVHSYYKSYLTFQTLLSIDSHYIEQFASTLLCHLSM